MTKSEFAMKESKLVVRETWFAVIEVEAGIAFFSQPEDQVLANDDFASFSR